MSDPKSFRTLISERHHEAEEALVQGDVEPRLRMWSHSDPVSLFGALGVSKSGWDELSPTFRSVASRLSGGRDVPRSSRSRPDTSHGLEPGRSHPPGQGPRRKQSLRVRVHSPPWRYRVKRRVP